MLARIAEIDRHILAFRRLEQETVFWRTVGERRIHQLEADKSALLRRESIPAAGVGSGQPVINYVVRLDRQGSSDFLNDLFDRRQVVTIPGMRGPQGRAVRRAVK